MDKSFNIKYICLINILCVLGYMWQVVTYSLHTTVHNGIVIMK